MLDSAEAATLFEADDSECLDTFGGIANAAARESTAANKADLAERLHTLAIERGMEVLFGEDAIQEKISRAFQDAGLDDRVPAEWPEPAHTNGGDGSATSPPILSKSQFTKGFRPPDYLVDGILQRKFLYALTGATGHAKTAIALHIATLVAAVRGDAMLGGHAVDRGKVIYLVGENPDDLRARVIGSDALRRAADRGDDPDTDQISFIPGVFDIATMLDVIAREAERLGGIDLTIVDTSAAYFFGDEELSNTQMGQHARKLRRLTLLPGGPCALVLCHPIKHVIEPGQLLPRGGGAFLAEVDGNLTVWKRDDVLAELYHNKIRGPGFEPMTFRLEKFTTPALVDSKGRLISTVRAVPISEGEEEATSRHARDDEDYLLTVMRDNADRSIADLARACDWRLQNGDPYKTKVARLLERLEKAKPKLVKRERGDRWQLTDAGKTAADAAASQRASADLDARRFQN